VALRNVTNKINLYNLAKIVKASIDDRRIIIDVDENARSNTEILDGCYVIKSDLPKESITDNQIHDRYKDLSKVDGFVKSHFHPSPYPSPPRADYYLHMTPRRPGRAGKPSASRLSRGELYHVATFFT
jgi:hypothetical protein